MDETDVGRVLAAAAPAPEAVPPVPDLSERARALGRRRRLRRTALTGGGAGVGMAALVGMVVALGGLGSGKAAPAAVSGGVAPAGGVPSSGAPARPSSPATPTAPASSTPSRPKALVPTKGATPSFPKASDNQTADAALTAALTAALPPKWQGEKLFRAAGTPGSYGAEYTWGSGLQEIVLDLSATNIAPTGGGGSPSLCQENPQQCTTGTATLLGHQVTWQYVATASAPTMTVTESKGPVSYSYMFSGGSGTQMPGLDVMKDVALNDQVASALVAGIGSGH